MVEPAFDVFIAGGGPSGSTLALRLAEFGWRVAIAEKSVFPRQHVGESLTSGVFPLLSAVGLRETIKSAGFLSSRWVTVDWAGESRRYQPHGGPGLLVDRARFDELLLRAATAMSGVRLLQPARVVRVEYVNALWSITIDTGETVHARYFVEASGRARILRRFRRALGAPTLAIYAYWTNTRDWEDGETLVESGESFWLWAAPLPGGQCNVMVFVDPGPAADYESLIQSSKLLSPRLREASRSSDIRICDATPFVDRAPMTGTSLKVGEAALAIDPLSSQGVQTAIGTALHAAIVLNTMMDRPADAELAREFYRSRIFQSADFHAAAAADFYRRQAEVGASEFWRKRAPREVPKPPPIELSPTARITLAKGLRFVPVAVAGEAYVTRHDGVRQGGKSYAFVGEGLPIAPMLRQIEGPTVAMEVVRRWSQAMPPRRALEVLQWAWAEGLIASEKENG